MLLLLCLLLRWGAIESIDELERILVSADLHVQDFNLITIFFFTLAAFFSFAYKLRTSVLLDDLWISTRDRWCRVFVKLGRAVRCRTGGRAGALPRLLLLGSRDGTHWFDLIFFSYSLLRQAHRWLGCCRRRPIGVILLAGRATVDLPKRPIRREKLLTSLETWQPYAIHGVVPDQLVLLRRFNRWQLGVRYRLRAPSAGGSGGCVKLRLLCVSQHHLLSLFE